MFMKLKMYMYNIRNRKEQIIKSYTYNRQCLIYWLDADKVIWKQKKSTHKCKTFSNSKITCQVYKALFEERGFWENESTDKRYIEQEPAPMVHLTYSSMRVVSLIQNNSIWVHTSFSSIKYLHKIL